MKPQGKLVLIGGAEEKEDHPSAMREKSEYYERFEILKKLLRVSKEDTIEIITTGSRIPEEIEKMYNRSFEEIGYKNPGFMHIQDHSDAREQHFLERVAKAGLIFFTGGIQERLVDILGETKIIDIIRKRYQEDQNFTVAGTSAGAMVMSKSMIKEGGVHEALIEGDIKTSEGLGLVPNCIIDTHFIKRGRFGRLAHAVALNTHLLGIGLGEDTALIIRQGDKAECFGSGMVVIIDGKYIGQTNVNTIMKSEPIYIENLKVDVLVKGCQFSLSERKLSIVDQNSK